MKTHNLFNRIFYALACVLLLSSCSREDTVLRRSERLPASEQLPAESSSKGKKFTTESMNRNSTADEAAENSRSFESKSISFHPPRPVTGDELRVEIETEPEHDPIRVQFHWKLNGELVQEGEEQILRHPIKAEDFIEVEASASYENGLDATSTHSIHVANAAPALRLVGENIKEDAYVARLEASDPEGDSIRFAVNSGPEGLTVDPETGIIRWPLKSGVSGAYGVELSAADSGGSQTMIAYQVRIRWETPDEKDEANENSR